MAEASRGADHREHRCCCCAIRSSACFASRIGRRGAGYARRLPGEGNGCRGGDSPSFQPERIKRAEGGGGAQKPRARFVRDGGVRPALSQEILDVPKLGTINVHASLLPRHRGSAPINWCVMMGEAVTGITTMMYTDIGMDTGDMLLKAETPIGGNRRRRANLSDRLSELGAELLIRTLRELEAGTLKRIPQNRPRPPMSRSSTRETGRIDWTKTAREIDCLVRGATPWPGARLPRRRRVRSRFSA